MVTMVRGKTEHMRYTYKDIAAENGRIRFTRGRFAGFTEPTGLLNVRYAIFQNSRSSVLMPGYVLTRETKEAIRKLGE
jgi:hypothetical protein